MPGRGRVTSWSAISASRPILRGALVEEVRRLAKGRSHEPVPANVGVELTRARVEPMVRGLFPRAEQDVVLATFEKSVVYVTSDTIEQIILNQMWHRSAWDLANLYLLSVGAKLLGKEAVRIVGLSEETTCYVSPEYFAEDDPFADFIVHGPRTSSTTANDGRSGSARRAGRSGYSISSSGNVRRSPIRARPTPASWRALRAPPSAGLWLPSTVRSGGLRRSAWSRTRWRASSQRRRASGTAGKRSWRGARRPGSCARRGVRPGLLLSSASLNDVGGFLARRRSTPQSTWLNPASGTREAVKTDGR